MHQMHLCIKKDTFFNKYYLSYDFAENSDSIQKGFEKKRILPETI